MTDDRAHVRARSRGRTRDQKDYRDPAAKNRIGCTGRDHGPSRPRAAAAEPARAPPVAV